MLGNRKSGGVQSLYQFILISIRDSKLSISRKLLVFSLVLHWKESRFVSAVSNLTREFYHFSKNKKKNIANDVNRKWLQGCREKTPNVDFLKSDAVRNWLIIRNVKRNTVTWPYWRNNSGKQTWNKMQDGGNQVSRTTSFRVCEEQKCEMFEYHVFGNDCSFSS